MKPDRNIEEVMNNLFDGVYIVNTDRKITYWNPAAQKITGFRSDEVLGKSCSDDILVHVDETGCCLCDKDCPLKDAMDGGPPCEGEVYLRHKEGYRIPVTVRNRILKNDEGRVEGAISIFRENSSPVASEELLEELRKLALLDSLTGLPNRRYIERTLSEHLAELERYNLPLGVLFIDIDDFKEVNDRYGHETGDGILKTISSTLSFNMRSSDIVGRWGGEEFVAVVLNASASELGTIAEKIRALVERSAFHGPSGPVGVTVSVGAAMARKFDTPSEVVDRADKLMYESKAAGKNAVTVESEDEMKQQNHS